jgi:hypothetical protein
MRLTTHGFGLILTGLGCGVLGMLPGCSADKSLGSDLDHPDAAAPSAGAGGNTGSAGAAGAGTGGSIAAGGATVSGGATGGASTSRITIATAGSLSGGAGIGGSSQAGSTGTGGTGTGTGTGGTGSVLLIAAMTGDGYILPTWKNQSQASIFLYGCGTTNIWKKNGADWVDLSAAAAFACAWEGVSLEVLPGASLADTSPASGPTAFLRWGAGTYRLKGHYGVGCTNPEAGLSKAGCTAYSDATSNEITLTAPTGTGGAGGSADAGAGGSTGGATALGGTSGSGGTGSVLLTASLTSNGYVLPTWKNQSQVSIFLYGCGTAEFWKKNGSDWVNLGTPFLCDWEGVSPQVLRGAIYADAATARGSIFTLWGAGTYRLKGRYGVGCTNPDAGQSKAGCTAFFEATSNEFTILDPTGTGGSGGHADGGVNNTGGTGGSTASGGTSGGGGTGSVSLTASLTNDGYLLPIWINQSQASIFLYGCGTTNIWKKNGADWVDLSNAAALACAWEGVSLEVLAGASYADTSPVYGSTAFLRWGAGTYRLKGHYGVGCTNPEAGLSKAGCTAYYDATSNEITIAAPPPATAADGGAGSGGGDAPADS